MIGTQWYTYTSIKPTHQTSSDIHKKQDHWAENRRRQDLVDKSMLQLYWIIPCFESSLSPHCGIINYRKAASFYISFWFFGRISIETDLYRDLIWWLDPLHYVLIVQINWLRSRNGLGTQFSFMTCEPIASGNNGQPSQSTQLKGLRLLKFNRSNSYFQNSSKTTNCLDRPILQFYRWKFCIRKKHESTTEMAKHCQS